MGEQPGGQEAMGGGSVDLQNFDLRAKCSKCRGERFSWHYAATGFHLEGAGKCPVAYGDEGEHLDLVCDRCSYAIGMKTADA